MKIRTQLIDTEIDKQVQTYGIRRMARAIGFDASNLSKCIKNKITTPEWVYKKVKKALKSQQVGKRY